ncbi:hypothetical protein JCM3775_002689 [Rhodotorula graminis]
MSYQRSDPRSLPLPALPSPSLASPPPAIVVHPFLAQSAAQQQPQLSTYTPSSYPHGPASPHYSPHPPRRSAAEEEKDAYFARSASVDSYGSYSHDEHWADVHSPGAAPLSVGGKPAPILLPPPRAAFVTEPGSPRSPMSLKQAMAFGDVGNVLDEKVGGRGAADMRKSGLDWARFSRMVKKSEAEKESEWLKRKQGIAKKWWVIGWAGSVAVIIAIIIALVVHFKSPSSDTAPTVSQLEGKNSSMVNSSSSAPVSLLPHSDAVPVAARVETSSSVNQPVMWTAAWRDLGEDDTSVPASSTERQVAPDVEATTSTMSRPLARATAATTSPTLSPPSTTSARVTARSTSSATTTSASTATTTSSPSRSSSTAAAPSSAGFDPDRRSKRWLRFGQDGKAERGDRKAWDAVEFVHFPIGDARRKRDHGVGAH